MRFTSKTCKNCPQFLKRNYSKKPARKIFTLVEFWISRAIFPFAWRNIAREIQNSTRVKIFRWVSYNNIPLPIGPYIKMYNSLFPVKISWKVEEILFQRDKTEKPLRMAFWNTSEASNSN